MSAECRTQYDAVVVGGGHNGLVAACYLAGAGQSVLVLERNETIGGATASQRVFPGVDACLSRYAYLVSLLPRQIVRDLGLHFSCRRRAIASCTPYERNGEGEALLLSNVDENRSYASFRRLTDEADWQRYQRFLEMQRAFAARVWPSVLQPLRSRAQWKRSLETPLEREAWDAFVERPLGETIERYVRSDLLRGLIFTDGKIGVLTHPHDPTLLQNRCFILHVIGGGTGEWQVPVGGMGALAGSLIAAARAAGVHIVASAPVDAISTGTPRHTVVFRHDGRERSVEATRILVNTGPQVLAQLLGTSYDPTPADEGSVCKVNMVLRRLPRLEAGGVSPRDAFAGTFHVDEGYDRMQTSYEQAARGEIPDHPPFEVYCHTLTDYSILGVELQDAGYHTLTLFGLDMPYRLFEENHDLVRAEVLRRYLKALNHVLSDRLEECLAEDAEGKACVEIMSPQDLERELALNRGNIFHTDPSWFFADDSEGVGTWGVETGHERIYRCGSSAMRGGGVSGIPGYCAAQRIFAELRVSTRVRRE